MAEFEPRAGYLHVTIAGVYTIAQARIQFNDILDALDRYGMERALVDARQITGSPRTMERFDFGEFTADAVAAFTQRHSGRVSPRIAYVLQGSMFDPGRLAETVAVNRGMDCRVFGDIDVALSWLLAGLPRQ